MSFHENTELHVKSACLFELEKAEKGWGKTYHSLHEGWAVLKEEVEEARFNCRAVKKCLKYTWQSISKDKIDSAKDYIGLIQQYAVEGMMELAQVWAVAEKMKNFWKEEE